MNSLTSLLGGILITQIVQVSLVILLVGLVTRLCLRSKPFLALALWTIVLIKCVTPPVLYSSSGMFCWIDVHTLHHFGADRALDTRIISSTDLGDVQGTAPDWRAERYGDSQAATAGEVKATDTTSWLCAAIFIWATGLLVSLLIYTIQAIRFLRRLRSEGIAPNASVERLVRRLSRYVRLRHSPRVVISPSNLGPAVFGLVRPTIILPQALVHDRRACRLMPIALHELMHVRRGDLWLALHSMLVRSVWWFHPLVWWAVRRAEWESERCCDESVVARMRSGPARYAHSLIDALAQAPRLQTVSFAAGMRPIDITADRLESIMKMRHGSHKRSSLCGWIFAILAAAIILPGAAGGHDPRSDAEHVVHQAVPPDTEFAVASPLPPAPPASAEATTKTDAVTTIRVYAVADLLKRLRQDEAFPEDASDEQVRLAFTTLLQILSPGTAAADRHPSTAPVQPSHDGKVDMRWLGDQLVVSASEEGHQALAKELEVRRRHSFRQISVEVRIMQGDPALCTAVDSETDSDSGQGQSDWRNQWILVPQEYANLESQLNGGSSGAVLAVGASSAPGVNVAVQEFEETAPPQAATSTGTSDPIVYQFLSDLQMKGFLNGLESDARANILLAPKVTVFDGQTVLISDTSQRPFVTDVQKVVGDNGTAYQPVITVLWEGTKIQLTPTIRPGGHGMKCRIMFAAIKDCREFRPPRFPDATDVVIQHPVATTSCFECSMEIPAGQTLLIGGLFPSTRTYDVQPDMIGRLLGQRPKKIARDEVGYIAITPRTLDPQ